MSAGLLAEGLTVVAGGRTILDGVDFAARPGEVSVIVGPNGAGKSTLLKALAGETVPTAGRVLLNGRPVACWAGSERARQRAVLPQTPELAFAFRAWEVVELGRLPHQGRATGREDQLAIEGAMAATETLPLAGAACDTLSGGELHRTHYARALTQIWAPLPEGRARVLLLDEPTASLDLFHQHAVLVRAREIAAGGSVAVVAVLHDLNLAAAYADRLTILAGGTVDASGPPAEVLTAERIRRVWRVAARVTTGADGRPEIAVAPLREAGRQAS